MLSAPLPPLPWKDVNAHDARAVARALGLKRADRRGGYPCPVCHGARLCPIRSGGDGGWICWSGCNEQSYSNVDVAAAVWQVRPADAVRRLAAALGVACPDANARPPVRASGGGAAPSRPPEHAPDPFAELRRDGVAPALPADVFAAVLAWGRILRTPADVAALADYLGGSFLPAELWRAGLWRIDATPDGGAVVLPAVPLPAVVAVSLAGALTFTPLAAPPA